MNNEKWIVCLKHGSKYSALYVNKLYSMAKRHSTVPFKFACLTEDGTGLNKDIKVLNLPMLGNTKGWWFKPYLFAKSFPLTGTILYFDLDLVIVNSIDKFWDYEPGQNVILQNFKLPKQPETSDFNSSIIRFTSQSLTHVWHEFVSDSEKIKIKYHGDQDWIFASAQKQFVTWPSTWAKSYKWEIRNKTDLEVYNNKYRFKSIANPAVSSDTSVLVFHGDPKPHETDDPIIVENWR